MTNDLPTPCFGHHLVETLNFEDFGKCLLYTQEVPWERYRDRFTDKPFQPVMVSEMGLDSLKALQNQAQECDTVIALGGGLAIDAAKYVAWKEHKRFIAIPTAISADVSVCRAVAVRDNWRVRYVGDKMPDQLIIDFDIVQSAPPHLNRGGVCDILSCYTALQDWQIAHTEAGEPIDPSTVEQTQDLLDQLYAHQQDIYDVTEKGIRFLVEGYLEEVRLCETYGSPRPEEGSEHFFAYNLEYCVQRPFLHGHIVPLGVVLMTMLQGRNPQQIIEFLDGAGVAWRPEQAGFSDEDLVQALETLTDYCANEKFYYTVIDQKRPNRNMALNLLDRLKAL